MASSAMQRHEIGVRGRAAAQRRQLHGAHQQRGGRQRGRQLAQRAQVGQVGPAGKAADLRARGGARQLATRTLDLKP